MAYHVTLASNIPSIMKNGIVPVIGSNSLACGETVARVYAFIDREQLETALMSWVDELFDDIDEGIELAFIEVADDCFENVFDSNGDIFFECHSYKTIPVEKILSIEYE